VTTHLVTFASEDMSRSAELCVESAKRHGVNRASRMVPAEPSTERGYGFWRWKPQAILAAMRGDDFQQPLTDGDILIYADAGVEFIDNVNYIIDRMDQDIFLFGNMFEHAHWCKRDIVEAVWPLNYHGDHNGAKTTCDCHEAESWARFGKQVQASVIFFRVNEHTRTFVKEWLHWCLWEGGRLIDDSPNRNAPFIKNHPEFQENRHDQAILTTLAYREGIKLHYWPAVYNRFVPGGPVFTYEKGEYADDYPPLFHHHRLRNHEWSVAA
jgi:hypothetical protein